MNRTGQRGAALLLSLVILLVLTMLAVSGMQGSLLQERMVAAQRDGIVTLEIAERAMRDVEALLDGLSDLDDFGTKPGFYETGKAPAVFSADTWNANGNKSATGTAIDGITPRYFVEYLGDVELDSEGELPRDLSVYGAKPSTLMDYARIVVMAQGPSGQSRRILEGYYVFKPGGLGN